MILLAIRCLTVRCLDGARELALVALGGLPRERLDEVIRERDDARIAQAGLAVTLSKTLKRLADVTRERDAEIDARRSRWS